MIGLIQRVKGSYVKVNNQIIGEINQGITLLLGIQQNDQPKNAKRLLSRILNYRIFNDANGKMNLSLIDIKASLLIIPQFTLAADTNSGNRPSFSASATPIVAKDLYDYFITEAQKNGLEHNIIIQTGSFGADMEVKIINDGPVTFWLQTP